MQSDSFMESHIQSYLRVAASHQRETAQIGSFLATLNLSLPIILVKFHLLFSVSSVNFYVKTIIGNGFSPRNVLNIFQNLEVGTKVNVHNVRRLDLEEFRMKYELEPVGSIYVATLTAQEIKIKNMSLTSFGVLRVENSFPEQSLVSICDDSGDNVASGVVRYSSYIIDRMKGMKLEEIEIFFDTNEIINRDHMVFLD
jgi:glutamate 5-kinase